MTIGTYIDKIIAFSLQHPIIIICYACGFAVSFLLFNYLDGEDHTLGHLFWFIYDPYIIIMAIKNGDFNVGDYNLNDGDKQNDTKP